MSDLIETAILVAILDNRDEDAKQKIASLNMTEAANLDAAANYMSNLCGGHWQRLHNAEEKARHKK